MKVQGECSRGAKEKGGSGVGTGAEVAAVSGPSSSGITPAARQN